MNTSYQQLIEQLEYLGLHKTALRLLEDKLLIESNKMTKLDFLIAIVQEEVKAKEEEKLTRIVKRARFPQLKKFESYDFSYLNDDIRDNVINLRHLAFLENKENIIFIGSPGVGKTHLAISVGLEACLNGKRTLYINCHELLLRLTKASQKGTLEKVLNRYGNYELLIIDEAGYLPIEKNQAYLFFQLINRRYERHSTVITTNLALSGWGDLFQSPETAAVILDRLIHHSQVFRIKGDSYRMKEALENDNS